MRKTIFVIIIFNLSLFNSGDHMDVKNLKEDGDWQVCFCAFDILYLNGTVSI